MGVQERIREVEEEISRTQKNKATEGVCHLPLIISQSIANDLYSSH